jgi:hypothetical protein
MGQRSESPFPFRLRPIICTEDFLSASKAQLNESRGMTGRLLWMYQTGMAQERFAGKQNLRYIKDSGTIPDALGPTPFY